MNTNLRREEVGSDFRPPDLAENLNFFVELEPRRLGLLSDLSLFANLRPLLFDQLALELDGRELLRKLNSLHEHVLEKLRELMLDLGEPKLVDLCVVSQFAAQSLQMLRRAQFRVTPVEFAVEDELLLDPEFGQLDSLLAVGLELGVALVTFAVG